MPSRGTREEAPVATDAPHPRVEQAVVEAEAADDASPAAAAAAGEDAAVQPLAPWQQQQVERLQALFEKVHAERMHDIPVCNEALRVEAVGFCSFQGRALGVLITPWFMNLVLLPGMDDDWSQLRTGEKITHPFPAGAVEFIVGREDGLVHQACSLFSPVFEFQEQEVARIAAQAALDALLQQREERSEAEEWQQHQEEEERRRREEEEARRRAEAEAARQPDAGADDVGGGDSADEGSTVAAQQKPAKPPLQRDVSRRDLFRGLLGGRGEEPAAGGRGKG